MTGNPHTKHEEWQRAKQASLNNRLYRISRELNHIAEHHADLRKLTIVAAIENAADDLEQIEKLQCELHRDE